MTEPTVHPAAALFPMLADDELQALADDIQANGLLHAIVLDADGQLIDGRNRLAACQLAGVEPRFEQLNGQDPIAFILSQNVHRRHLSQGQLAVLTMQAIMLETNKNTPTGRGRPTKSAVGQKEAAEASGVKRPRLALAQVVIEHAPDLAGKIVTGEMGLDAAHVKACERRDAQAREATAYERALQESARQMTALRRAAPDLADLVQAGSLTMPEAQQAATARANELRERRSRATQHMGQLLAALLTGAMTPQERGAMMAVDVDWAAITTWLPDAEPMTPERFQVCLDTLQAIAEQWTTGGTYGQGS